jgi:uncharacterized protein involved in exopolysaccharide biosynthesis
VIGDVWGATRGRSNVSHEAAMKSPQVLREALSRLSGRLRAEFRRYQDDLSRLPVAIRAPLNTDIIAIQVRATSREAALALADAVVSAYTEQTKSMGVQLTREAASSLENEAALALRDAATAESMLNRRRQESGVYDPAPTLSAAAARASELRNQMSDTRSALAAATREMQANAELRTSVPRSLLASETSKRGAMAEELEKGVASIQLTEAHARGTFREDSPQMQVFASQRAIAESRLASAPKSVPSEETHNANPTWLSVDKRTAELTAEEAGLRERLKALDRELAGQLQWLHVLSEEETRQAELSSGVTAHRANYASIVRELSILRAGALARLPTVSALGRATAPRRGSRGMGVMLLTGLLVGVVLSLVVVFLVESRSARAALSPAAPASTAAE